MIYVHIPFCRSFCTYCGFYSEPAPRCKNGQERNADRIVRFRDAFVKEIQYRREEIISSSSVNTLYFGGGTPSVLPLCVLSDMTEAINSALGTSAPYEEFTVEVNPDDIVHAGSEYLDGLIRLGVNRISMGVQSFDADLLKWMNRRHSPEQARQAYGMLVEAGFRNISIDLIFGLSHLSDEKWSDTISQALSLGAEIGVPPSHISAYQLSIEPDSALEKLVERGRYVEADELQCERQYRMLCEALAAAGYRHYEISNFALPGCEARHNSAYWAHRPYIGLGPGAHSFLCGNASSASALASESASASLTRNAMRRWNEPDLEAYLSWWLDGGKEACGGEVLDAYQLSMERIMLGLRTDSGVCRTELDEVCRKNVILQMLSDGHLVEYQCEGVAYVRIPERFFFISDALIAELF